jgi:hypothetical protein
MDNHKNTYLEKRERIINALRRSGGSATRREILRQTKMRLKDFEEVAEVMKAKGELKVEFSWFEKKGRGRKPSPLVSLNLNDIGDLKSEEEEFIEFLRRVGLKPRVVALLLARCFEDPVKSEFLKFAFKYINRG